MIRGDRSTACRAGARARHASAGQVHRADWAAVHVAARDHRLPHHLAAAQLRLQRCSLALRAHLYLAVAWPAHVTVGTAGTCPARLGRGTWPVRAPLRRRVRGAACDPRVSPQPRRRQAVPPLAPYHYTIAMYKCHTIPPHHTTIPPPQHYYTPYHPNHTTIPYHTTPHHTIHSHYTTAPRHHTTIRSHRHTTTHRHYPDPQNHSYIPLPRSCMPY
jgi:hypothetical protein